MLQILERYKDIEDPDMGLLNGKAYETLSKDECLEELKKFRINGLNLCRLGNINPLPENLCKMVFFAKATAMLHSFATFLS